METSSLIFSVLAFLFSILNFIELRASKLSTHSVQYIDPWKDATTEKTIDKINEDVKFENSFDSNLI